MFLQCHPSVSSELPWQLCVQVLLLYQWVSLLDTYQLERVYKQQKQRVPHDVQLPTLAKAVYTLVD